MIDKQVNSMAEALADIADGASVLVGGFGPAGWQAIVGDPRGRCLAEPADP